METENEAKYEAKYEAKINAKNNTFDRKALPGKHEKMYSLKRQISGILVAAICVFAVLMGILLALLIYRYQKDLNEAYQKETDDYAETLNESLLQLNDSLGTIYSSDTDFVGLSSQLSTSPVKKYDYIYNLLNSLQIQVNSDQNICGLFVFYDEGANQVYFVDNKMSFKDKEALKNTGKAYAKDRVYNYESHVIDTGSSIYYSIFLKKDFATLMGAIRMDQGISDDAKDGTACGVVCDGDFYQTSGDQEILDEQACAALVPGQNRVDGKIVYVSALASAEISAVKIVPETPWMYFSTLHIFLGVLIICLIFLLLRLYRFLYAQIANPLEDMNQALSRIRDGVWEVHFDAENRITEIENVRQTVRVMLKEIEDYKIRNYEEKIGRQKTELQYLKLQLAPHFYTNCLKNAYYMLALKDYDNASQFLLCLSTHLRYLLQKDTYLVRVQTERNFVENYLTMQHLMTTRSISCEIEIQKEAEHAEIPILGLQTFVENSLKYGWQTDGERLQIMVHVQLLKSEGGEFLDILVRDNGRGYPEEILNLLNHRMPQEQESLGVGVLNLLIRTRLLYGEKASWYFENKGGAVSELLIPLKAQESEGRTGMQTGQDGNIK